MCNVEQETVPHIMCKSRHDKMLRPLYHFTLDKYGFEEPEVNKPWHQQSLPQPVMENQKAKIYWDIHHYVTNCLSNNANKLDIAIFDKENNKWITSKGQCAISEKSKKENCISKLNIQSSEQKSRDFTKQRKFYKSMLCSTSWQFTTKL